MVHGMTRLTPATSRRIQLLLAALMWVVVGGTLAFFGAHWLGQSEWPWWPVAAAAAIAVGLLKARFILRHTARRVVQRIEERGDGRCVGGMFSWTTWLFIIAMMALGQILRRSPMPLWALGAIYLAVGLALLTASRHVWSAWRTAVHRDQSASP
jgi:hypothetical protein